MSARFPKILLLAAVAVAPVFAVRSASAQQSIAAHLTKAPASQNANVTAPVNAQGDRLPVTEPAYTVAQVAATTLTEMAEVERVVVHGFDVEPVEYPALPEVEGTRINSGKKTSFVKPSEFPEIANNSFREALATTPGLLVSEEPNSPIINLGYRGLDSQRSESIQVLKDGLSIKNEQFGFPESHYTPILDAVERIEFIRAGASLQFGPQPGGAVNFVTKMPRRDAPFHFTTKNLFGTDELYQNFTEIDGTFGSVGYYAYYDHRERDGFRANSDYDLNAGSVKFVIDAGSDSRFVATVDIYDEEHGEPGGFRTTIDPTVPFAANALYQVDRNRTTRQFDRFRLQRYYGTLEYQKNFSDRTQLDIKGFAGYLQRYSKRQRGGGFGISPFGNAANTNDVQIRDDYTQGAEARLRHDYDFAGSVSTFAGGLYFYHATQDRTDERGATPDADRGVLRRFNQGETTDGAVFGENLFRFGRLSITPGFRLEFFQQGLEERVNTTKVFPPLGTDRLLTRSDFSFVPLFSLGASYIILEGQQVTTTAAKDYSKDMKNVASAVTPGGPPRLEIYGTVAQAYRPRTYGELVPTSPGGIVNGDLEEGHALQFELGLRGKPLPYLTFDLGGFYFNFEDQVGDITLNGAPTTGNVGDARYIGFEAAGELDLLAMFNGGTESRYGRFNVYGNVTLLDAQFDRGPFDGNDTTYAPDYQVKIGGIYRWKEAVKVGLLGTFVDDSFAAADNGIESVIPAYAVWDLTAEVNFFDGRVGVFGGIHNLFNEDYYGEIRDEGIVPAYKRNYYGGVSFKF